MKPIETTELTKYYGTKRGIEGVNLEVDSGEIFGFIGPNGAGKTTTIRTLLDLIFPTGGSARIFGLDTHSRSKDVKRSVGYLPSEDYFYKDMSARQLLEYSAAIYGLDPRPTGKRIASFAETLDLDLEAKIKTLSRGNRRKVSIIRCLLPGAKLLILDEPTSGLDPLMQVRFFELLEAERERGTTIFFSSHILSEVQKICSRVAIIRNGRIVRTEKIGALEKEHLKKVMLEMRPPHAVEELRIPGVSELTVQDGTVRFLYRGELGPLLSYLVESGIHDHLDNLLIERSTLDEIFMDYYRDGEVEA